MWAAAGPGIVAHRTGHGRGPRRARRGTAGAVRHAATVARVQDASQSGHGREGGRGDRRQTGHRRRFQSDGADDRRAVGLAASDVRVRGDRRGRPSGRQARNRRWLGDDTRQVASRHQRRPQAQRAQVCYAAEHYEGQEEADQEGLARRPRRGRGSAPTSVDRRRPAYQTGGFHFTRCRRFACKIKGERSFVTGSSHFSVDLFGSSFDVYKYFIFSYKSFLLFIIL